MCFLSKSSQRWISINWSLDNNPKIIPVFSKIHQVHLAHERRVVGRVARIRENGTDPDPDPFRKIFTDPDLDPDPKRIRQISQNCYGISYNTNIFKGRCCNCVKIAVFWEFFWLQEKFPSKLPKNLQFFCHSEIKFEKNLWCS